MNELEAKDAVEYLTKVGFGKLLDCLADPKLYKKSGKLKITGLARRMRTSDQAMKEMLDQARFLLEEDETHISTSRCKKRKYSLNTSCITEHQQNTPASIAAISL